MTHVQTVKVFYLKTSIAQRTHEAILYIHKAHTLCTQEEEATESKGGHFAKLK